MTFLQQFNWKELLFGEEDWQFLPQVLIRTLIMFIVIVSALTILGKRGVKQLSVFELVVIIGLGTAAGDPMLYRTVGILPAILIFVIIIGLYTLVTYWVGKNKRVERILEGKPIYLVREGKFAIENFSKEHLGLDEFFAELREYGVSHLGQVEYAILETNGSISVFFYADKDIKYGLPILPESLEKQHKKIKAAANYACIFCGNTEKLEAANKHTCKVCHKDDWIQASNKKRIS